ncbi:MAG: hypothetical protein RLZZ241_2054 [Bacteroidota bacterium]|jgi:glycosyltransferase involved in cell wall biosynthesis
MSTLSIITIVLNKEDSIEETLQSVIFQLEPEDEFIVIDGGSSDKTTSIIQKYRNKITHYISEPDQGIYDAMNKGINLANGDLIGILNGGDTYTSGALKIAREFEGDVLTGNMLKWDRKRNRKQLIKRDERFLKRLPGFMVINHPATFVSKAIYDQFGSFNCNYKILGDKDFFLRLLHQQVKFTFTQQTLAVFETGGISGKLSSIPLQVMEAFRIRKNLGYGFFKNLSLSLTYITHRTAKGALRLLTRSM